MNAKDKKLKKERQTIEDISINKSGTPDDAAQVNHQVKDKKEHHQPRDNA
ncbi:hypothetical protein ACWGOQ_0020135 [Aquimarina sp. M1]